MGFLKNPVILLEEGYLLFVFLFVFLVAFLFHVEHDGDHTHPDKAYPEHHRGDDGHGRVFAKVLDE